VRPKTATSTILTAIGGSLYAGNSLDYTETHIPLLVVTTESLPFKAGMVIHKLCILLAFSNDYGIRASLEANL
jgi:hypothetical protein